MFKVAFQGEKGAFGHAAVNAVFPNEEAMPCVTFENTIAAVQNGDADYAMVPVENSLYGRITDIHHILPESGLKIIGEHYHRVNMCLLGIKGTKLDQVEEVQSLSVALGQCRKFIRDHKLLAINSVDTAGSAREVAEHGDRRRSAIASKLAGEIYGLDLLAEDIEDEDHNTTRFLIMSREMLDLKAGTPDTKTTFVFRVRNVPAALYKAMGGFATNGINMTKLESYMVDGNFTATQFYADIEGHPEDRGVNFALEELAFFTDYINILGVYPSKKSHDDSGNQA